MPDQFVIAVAHVNGHQMRLYLRRPTNEGFSIITDNKEQVDPPKVDMIKKWMTVWYLGSSAIL